MHTDEIFKMLKNIETEIHKLYKNNKISKSTLNMIRVHIKNIRESLINVTESIYEKEIIFKSIAEELDILDILARAIKNNASDTRARALTHEMLSLIAETYSIDLFLIESDPNRPPLENYCYKEEDELTFFLLFSSSDYLNQNRIGLIAHEVSHVNEIVEKNVESTRLEKRKIGEILADILGLYLAGPVFADSISFIIISDFGVNHLSKIYNRHPSWITRIIVMQIVNKEIWKTETFKRMIHEILSKVAIESPPLSEDLLITKSIKEYQRHKMEFGKFKINEKEIVNFKNSKSDSILYKLNARYFEVN